MAGKIACLVDYPSRCILSDLAYKRVSVSAGHRAGVRGAGCTDSDPLVMDGATRSRRQADEYNLGQSAARRTLDSHPAQCELDDDPTRDIWHLYCWNGRSSGWTRGRRMDQAKYPGGSDNADDRSLHGKHSAILWASEGTWPVRQPQFTSP